MNTNSTILFLPHDRAERVPQEWGELTWFANSALANSQELTLGRCRIAPGQSNPRHYHPNCSEVLTVFKGRILHTDASGGRSEMNEGDTVTIAPNVWHQATNIGDDDAILVIVFTSADRQTVGE
jgi:quercetin dioxygenase-like cupin family protein